MQSSSVRIDGGWSAAFVEGLGRGRHDFDYSWRSKTLRAAAFYLRRLVEAASG